MESEFTEGFKASGKEAESNKESGLWTGRSWQNSSEQWLDCSRVRWRINWQVRFIVNKTHIYQLNVAEGPKETFQASQYGLWHDTQKKFTEQWLKFHSLLKGSWGWWMRFWRYACRGFSACLSAPSRQSLNTALARTPPSSAPLQQWGAYKQHC